MAIIASNFKTNHTRKSTSLFINEVNEYLKSNEIKNEVSKPKPNPIKTCFFGFIKYSLNVELPREKSNQIWLAPHLQNHFQLPIDRCHCLRHRG